MIDEEETDQVDEMELHNENKKRVQKQDSRVSVTSGEYEEIFLTEGEFDDLVDIPPPLPPRKNNKKSSPSPR